MRDDDNSSYPWAGAAASLLRGAGPLFASMLTVGACLSGQAVGADDDLYDPGSEVSAEELLDWILEETPSEPSGPAWPWEADLSARAGGGYKENVLYSAVVPLDSGFSRIEGDLFLLHRGAPDQDLFLYAYGDQQHYFELDRAQDEQTAYVEGSWTQWAPRGRLNLKGHYSYLDQFFDSSISNVDIQSSRLRQHEGGVSTFIERETLHRVYARLGGALRDVDVKDYPDDYWAWEAEGRLELRPRPSLAFGLAYLHMDEDYDERPQRTTTGEPLPGTAVHIVDDSLALYARSRWGSERRWGTEVRVTGILRTDDGGGYYDYQAWRGRLLLRGPLYRWRWEGGMYYGDTDYDARPSRYGAVAAPPLYREWLQFRLRLDHDLGSHWNCFAEVFLQENRSNNPLDVYDHRWAALGLGYEF